MNIPQWVKPAWWGVVVGTIGIMILGFAWGGWVLGSTAERMAKAWADEAVTAVLVPICVERFMGQADAAAQLAAFQNTVSWRQSQLIEQGGWATATGSKDPNTAVARMCAQQLVTCITTALMRDRPGVPATGREPGCGRVPGKVRHPLHQNWVEPEWH
jgi:hypothetical protein